MTTKVVTDEQLGILARRQNDLFRRVREGTLPVERVLGGLQSLIEGAFDTIPVGGPGHLIKCDVAPYIQNGWSVRPEDQITSAVRGDLILDSSKITLYFSERQKNGKAIVGNDLHKELEGKPVLTAHVLDDLLAKTNLIPEAWKGRTIFFWGTVYRVWDGNLYVRYLYWLGGMWNWRYGSLDNRFDDQSPALLAS